MPHTRDIIMVRMVDDDDRFVTRPVMIPVHALEMALMIPDLQNNDVVSVEVCPYPHTFNYPTPGYYRVKPAGTNPYPHPFPVSYGFGEGGVLAEWRFDEAVGATEAIDEVSGYVLTEAGNPTWQQTAAVAGLGSGIVFDGTGDILTVAIASAPNLDITTGDFSVEMVVTLTSAIAETVLVEHRAATDGVGWSIGTDATDQLEAKLEDATAEVALTGETDIADATKKHIVVTFDRDGNMTPYIDGVAGTAVDISGSPLTLSNIGAFAVGGDSDSANLTTGTFWFLRVYNRVLSADEVLQNYRILMGGGEWPGWMDVIDQADGAVADVVASAVDPGAIDITLWLRAFRGMYARVAMTTEQTTTRTYDFGWVFSGVT